MGAGQRRDERRLGGGDVVSRSEVGWTVWVRGANAGNESGQQPQWVGGSRWAAGTLDRGGLSWTPIGEKRLTRREKINGIHTVSLLKGRHKGGDSGAKERQQRDNSKPQKVTVAKRKAGSGRQR